MHMHMHMHADSSPTLSLLTSAVATERQREVRLFPLVPSPDVQNRTSPVESGASGFTPSPENLRVQRLAVNTVLTVSTETPQDARERWKENRKSGPGRL